MATTRHQSADADAALLKRATFVHCVTRADGDGLAAAAILAGALDDRGTPYQLSVATSIAERTDRASTVDREGDDVTITIGAGGETRLDGDAEAATLAAWEVATTLETTPDPTLALAGIVAAGLEPDDVQTVLERADVEQVPGLSTPLEDSIEGIALSHRCLAPWSGDPAAAAAALGDSSDARRCASLVAIDAVSSGTTHAAAAIRDCLHPYAITDGPVATVGGYAEVLEALAEVDPGRGLALALEGSEPEEGIQTWRSVGEAVHDAIPDGELTERGGLAVLETEAGPLRLIADLLLDYRATQPTVLVVGEDEAAISSRTTCRDALEAIAASEDAYDTVADGTAGTAVIEGSADDLVEVLE